MRTQALPGLEIDVECKAKEELGIIEIDHAEPARACGRCLRSSSYANYARPCCGNTKLGNMLFGPGP